MNVQAMLHVDADGNRVRPIRRDHPSLARMPSDPGGDELPPHSGSGRRHAHGHGVHGRSSTTSSSSSSQEDVDEDEMLAVGMARSPRNRAGSRATPTPPPGSHFLRHQSQHGQQQQQQQKHGRQHSVDQHRHHQHGQQQQQQQQVGGVHQFSANVPTRVRRAMLMQKYKSGKKNELAAALAAGPSAAGFAGDASSVGGGRGVRSWRDARQHRRNMSSSMAEQSLSAQLSAIERRYSSRANSDDEGNDSDRSGGGIVQAGVKSIRKFAKKAAKKAGDKMNNVVDKVKKITHDHDSKGARGNNNTNINSNSNNNNNDNKRLSLNGHSGGRQEALSPTPRMDSTSSRSRSPSPAPHRMSDGRRHVFGRRPNDHGVEDEEDSDIIDSDDDRMRRNPRRASNNKFNAHNRGHSASSASAVAAAAVAATEAARRGADGVGDDTSSSSAMDSSLTRGRHRSRAMIGGGGSDDDHDDHDDTTTSNSTNNNSNNNNNMNTGPRTLLRQSSKRSMEGDALADDAGAGVDSPMGLNTNTGSGVMDPRMFGQMPLRPSVGGTADAQSIKDLRQLVYRLQHDTTGEVKKITTLMQRHSAEVQSSQEEVLSFVNEMSRLRDRISKLEKEVRGFSVREKQLHQDLNELRKAAPAPEQQSGSGNETHDPYKWVVLGFFVTGMRTILELVLSPFLYLWNLVSGDSVKLPTGFVGDYVDGRMDAYSSTGSLSMSSSAAELVSDRSKSPSFGHHSKRHHHHHGASTSSGNSIDDASNGTAGGADGNGGSADGDAHLADGVEHLADGDDRDPSSIPRSPGRKDYSVDDLGSGGGGGSGNGTDSSRRRRRGDDHDGARVDSHGRPIYSGRGRHGRNVSRDVSGRRPGSARGDYMDGPSPSAASDASGMRRRHRNTSGSGSSGHRVDPRYGRRFADDTTRYGDPRRRSQSPRSTASSAASSNDGRSGKGGHRPTSSHGSRPSGSGYRSSQGHNHTSSNSSNRGYVNTSYQRSTGQHAYGSPSASTPSSAASSSSRAIQRGSGSSHNDRYRRLHAPRNRPGNISGQYGTAPGRMTGVAHRRVRSHQQPPRRLTTHH